MWAPRARRGPRIGRADRLAALQARQESSTPSKGGGPLASADGLGFAALAGASVVAQDAPDGIPRPRLNPALPVNPIGFGAAWGWDDCENRPSVDQEAGSEASDDVART
jgi:hypothetical protein